MTSLRDYLNEANVVVKTGQDDLDFEQMAMVVKVAKSSLIEGSSNMNNTPKKNKAYVKAIKTIRILQDDIKDLQSSFK